MSVVSGSQPPALPGGGPDETSTARDRIDGPTRRRLRRSGLPAPWTNLHPILRVLTHPLFWASVVVVAGMVVSSFRLIATFVPDREVPGGVALGLGTEAPWLAAEYARITVIPLVMLFLLADRFRIQRFTARLWVWFVAFGWGALISTYLAAEINTWAAARLSIEGNGDPSTGIRAAIFVAPFVEEAMKGTVLFWIAILLRYRWVNRLGALALAGVSAAGFAFVENIIYYARAYRYAGATIGPYTPEQALQELFRVRGLASFFAHPLFTLMLGIGLAVALRTRSKTVRIIAPLAGFLGAALLHMAWNGVASTGGDATFTLYLLVAIPLVLAVTFFMIRQVGREKALLRARLDDYVVAGWLSEPEQLVISSPLRRLGAQWWGMFAWRPESLPSRMIGGAIGAVLGLAVVRGLIGLGLGWTLVGILLFAAIGFGVGGAGPVTEHIRLGTELGYLRDAVTRGLVDDAGTIREEQILVRMRELRDSGLELMPTTPVAYPWRVYARSRQERTDQQSWAPAPGATSGVDPSWAPPGR